MLTAVVSVNPIANGHNAPVTADIWATFDRSIDVATATSQSLVVHSSRQARPFAVSVTGDQVRASAASASLVGESVQVTATSWIESTGGEPAEPYVWSFRTAVSAGSGAFVNAQRLEGDGRPVAARLGDLDGDGDLDAIAANDLYWGNRVWVNRQGRFYSDQLLGDHDSTDVELGDLDHDGDLDAFVTNRMQGNRVWTNNDGQFTGSGQSLGDHHSTGVALGDLDGDGDLDAFVTNSKQTINDPAFNRIWLNDQGVFTDSGQQLGSGSFRSRAVSLGDLDNDGDLDAFVGGAPSRVWTNGGNGKFTDSGQSLGGEGRHVSTGDLDGDGDLDALVSSSGSNRVWLNRGDAVFNSGQRLEGGRVTATLGDLDGDGDLDVYTDNGKVWLNYEGQFVDNRQTEHPGIHASLGDLDGDGDLDSFVLDSFQQGLVRLQSFSVTSFTATNSGFEIQFNSDLDSSSLNVYDDLELGPADIALRDEAGNTVSGSLLIGESRRSLTFVKTGGPLASGTYTVTLHSADNGFKDLGGQLLDGDTDGIAGPDFTTTFSIFGSVDPANISLPDIVRGPGQSVEIPADQSTGIPVSITDGAGVTAIDLQLSYDPTLLELTAATVGPDMPPDATAFLDTRNPGLAVLNFRSPTPLPGGQSTFANLHATVPSDADAYGRQQLVDMETVAVRDSSGNHLSVIADDAVHLVSYLGDVSGNGRVNASDASQIARVAAGLDSGFAVSLLTDPMIVGDVSGNGRINAADASLVAEFAAQLDVRKIPPIPLELLGARFAALARRESQEEVPSPPERLRPLAVDAVYNKEPAYLPTAEIREISFSERDREALSPLEDVIDDLASPESLSSMQWLPLRDTSGASREHT